MIHSSSSASLTIPNISLPRLLRERARLHQNRAAIVDAATGRRWTYGELWSAAEGVAGGLARRGVDENGVVAIWSANTLEYPAAVYGTMMTGACVTTINPLYNATEVTQQLRDASARVLIASPALASTAQQVAAAVGIRDVYTFGCSEQAAGASFDSLIDARAMPEHVTLDSCNAVAEILYSSATTSLPKGIMLTHRNLVANVLQIHAMEGMQPDEIVLGLMPFHHVYGLNAVLNQTMYAGATLVVLGCFEVEPFLDALERYGVTTAFVVPPIVRTLATHPLVERFDLSRLKQVISAAAPLPEHSTVSCATRIGCEIRQVYGLTEASPATHHTPRGAAKIDASGVAVPNTEWMIVDVSTQRELGTGAIGEVWIRGPQIMKGYLNNPEVTGRTIDQDGWLRTGDIGYADEDGYLFVLDRAKDALKFRGLQYRESELLLTVVEESTRRREADRQLRRNQEMLQQSHEQLRNLAARLMTIREHERTTLARELHDQLGQSLTRLAMDVTWLVERLPARLRTTRSLGLVPMIEQLVAVVQHLSWQQRPAVIDDLGLEAAIECEAEQFREWCGCQCDVDLRIESLPVDDDRDIAVFRILQEALVNVARHAKASHVLVKCLVDAAELILNVEDDGHGVPPERLASPDSLGVLGMRERAHSIGGTLEISPRPEGGSVVRLRVPLPTVAAARNT